MHASTVAIDLAKGTDRHPSRGFHDGPGVSAHPRPDTRPQRTASRRSTISYGNDCLTGEPIHELLGCIRWTEKRPVRSGHGF